MQIFVIVEQAYLEKASTREGAVRQQRGQRGIIAREEQEQGQRKQRCASHMRT
jgi:hypothetical protein